MSYKRRHVQYPRPQRTVHPERSAPRLLKSAIDSLCASAGVVSAVFVYSVEHAAGTMVVVTLAVAGVLWTVLRDMGEA